MRFLTTLYILALFGCTTTKPTDAAPKAKPNVLFIAIDDLRPELGCYGSPVAVTPNIDALAAKGLRFNRAYCQQAICSPSRASVMTGARPETIGVIENYTYFRDANPDIITLPQHFRANGYETVYSGKVYHGKYTDKEKSWSRNPVKISAPRPSKFALSENMEAWQKERAEIKKKYANREHYAMGQGPAYESADVPDITYKDGYNTEVAIATLKEIAKGDKPFFLAMGYSLPHLNWTAPTKYWDMYDRDEIPMADQPAAPENGAAMGLHASFELRVRSNIPKSGQIKGDLARTLKHAYLASVSYVDAQIGKLLAAMEAEGVLENTIVILWTDHGWHLGDMGVWGKATNYEIATRVPLIIHTPDLPKKTRGASTEALVELVDMYPTLCDLAGINLPTHLEGKSFVPLIKKPTQAWKKAAFSQFPSPALREWGASPLSSRMRETYFGPLIEEVEDRIKTQQANNWDRDVFENYLMGYAMRTDRYRFVVWKDRRDKDALPIYFELYDHQNDPQEQTNIAAENPDLVTALLHQFNEGWRGSLVP